MCEVGEEEKIKRLYRKSENEYKEMSINEVKKYNMSHSDKQWMKKIMSGGTFKDKVSALSIYIQETPIYTLSTL